ncbi:MAG: putative metallopeptidase [bacterium]
MFESYATAMQSVIADITYNVDEFSYIDPDQIIVNFKKARETANEEVWAEITGLSDDDHGSVQQREGRVEMFYYSNSLLFNGTPVKYIIDFYVPLFFNLTFKDKLTTIFHELYHISPRFDGELRLFKGKAYQHGPSMEKYDRYMEYLVDKYLLRSPEAADFLKSNKEELAQKVRDTKIPRMPKPEPLLFRITWC